MLRIVQILQGVLVLIIAGVLLSASRLSPERFLEWKYDKSLDLKHDCQNFKLFFVGKLGVHENRKRSLIDHISLACDKVGRLGHRNWHKVTLFLERGQCGSYAYPDDRLVVLSDAGNCNGAITHELIHVRYGLFAEKWLTEGLATYLSRYLKSRNPDLAFYHDINDDWYGDKSSNEILCPIEQLKITMSAESVRNLLNTSFTERFVSDEEKLRFYQLSGAFCEFLVTKSGVESLIDVLDDKPLDKRVTAEELFGALLEDSPKDLMKDWISTHFK